MVGSEVFLLKVHLLSLAKRVDQFVDIFTVQSAVDIKLLYFLISLIYSNCYSFCYVYFAKLFKLKSFNLRLFEM